MRVATCALLLLGCWLHSVTPYCLQTGCEFTNGLYQRDISSKIRSMVDKRVQPNILKIMTWNILYDIGQSGAANWIVRKDEICDYINKMNPMIFALQEVRASQLADLKACLSRYLYVGEARSSRYNPEYNPIFYRRTRMLRKVDDGTFWLSKSPNTRFTKLPSSTKPRVCTWAKFRYAVRVKLSPVSTKVEGAGNMLLRLLYRATGKQINESMMRRRMKPRKRVIYSWKTFYVANTHLDGKNVENAADEVNILLDNIRNNVMDRRRYPLFLMGDMNWEAGTKLYKAIGEHELKLKDVMTSSQESYPAVSKVDMETGYDLNSPGKGLVDQIWSYGATSIFSGTLMDRRTNGRQLSDHRPIITATKL